MVVMSIGITAIVAGYSSGILAVDRAKAGTTAGALADRQMETFRQGSIAAVPTNGLQTPTTTPDGYWMQVDGSWSCAIGTARRWASADVHEHACEPPGEARDDHRPRRLEPRGSSSSPRPRPSTPRPADNLFDPRNRHGCIRI